jgi:hypothetical protein
LALKELGDVMTGLEQVKRSVEFWEAQDKVNPSTFNKKMKALYEAQVAELVVVVDEAKKTAVTSLGAAYVEPTPLIPPPVAAVSPVFGLDLARREAYLAERSEKFIEKSVRFWERESGESKSPLSARMVGLYKAAEGLIKTETAKAKAKVPAAPAVPPTPAPTPAAGTPPKPGDLGTRLSAVIGADLRFRREGGPARPDKRSERPAPLQQGFERARASAASTFPTSLTGRPDMRTSAPQSEGQFKKLVAEVIKELKLKNTQPGLPDFQREARSFQVLKEGSAHGVVLNHNEDNTVSTVLPNTLDDLKQVFPKILAAHKNAGMTDLELNGPQENVEFMARECLKQNITPKISQEFLEANGFADSRAFLKALAEKKEVDAKATDEPDEDPEAEGDPADGADQGDDPDEDEGEDLDGDEDDAKSKYKRPG